MDRIDRLIAKATSKTRLFDRLKKDNPYLGKSFRELLDYMSGSDRPEELQVPQNGTLEKDKFNYAFLEAFCTRRKEQKVSENGKD